MLRLDVVDFKNGTTMVNHIYKDGELIKSFDEATNKIDFHCLDGVEPMPMTIARYKEDEDGQLCIDKIQEVTFETVVFDNNNMGILKYT